MVRGEFVVEREESAMPDSDQALGKDDVLYLSVAGFVRDVERTIRAERSDGTCVYCGAIGTMCQGATIERITPGDAAKKSREMKGAVRSGKTLGDGRMGRAG